MICVYNNTWFPYEFHCQTFVHKLFWEELKCCFCVSSFCSLCLWLLFVVLIPSWSGAHTEQQEKALFCVQEKPILRLTDVQSHWHRKVWGSFRDWWKSNRFKAHTEQQEKAFFVECEKPTPGITDSLTCYTRLYSSNMADCDSAICVNQDSVSDKVNSTE